MSDFICSKCGGEVQILTLTVNPPVTDYWCSYCGARRREVVEHKPVVINMSDDK